MYVTLAKNKEVDKFLMLFESVNIGRGVIMIAFHAADQCKTKHFLNICVGFLVVCGFCWQ